MFEGELQWDGIGDLRDVGAAGLFGGFEGDAAPAFDTLGSSQSQVLFRAAGEDRGHAGDAEFGGFFDGPFQMIELEDGEEQVQGKGCVGLELFVEGEANLCIGDGYDFGSVEKAVGDDVVDLARFRAEDAGQVGSLVTRESG